MNRPRRYSRTTLRLFAAGAGLTITSATLAQDALGDGRGLQQQPPGLSSRLSTAPIVPNAALRSRAFERELAFRESIVTGTAPGGLAFRGETIPSRFEFRGELGSDDLFAFRRDSMYSGLAGQGIRGTDALQYQFSLTTGHRPPTNLAGPLSVQRGGGRSDWSLQFQDNVPQPGRPEAPLSRITPEEPREGEQVPASDLRVRPAWETSSLSQSIRSTADYTANRSLQPTMLTVVSNTFTREAVGITAAPLTGILTHRIGAIPHTVPGVPSEIFAPPRPETDVPTALDLALPSTAIEPGRPQSTYARTAYEQVIERMARRYAEANPIPATTPEGVPLLPEWIADLGRLRLELHFPRPPTTPDPTTLPDQPAPTTSPPPGEQYTPPDPLQGLLPQPPAQAPGTGFRLSFDPATLRMIRETGGVAETFIPAEVNDRNIFFEHMRRGEELLAQNRYFDAEERFVSALAARPGDVTARFGRVHAEIGGGLFLSAATNLRKLLFDNPEAAALRWGSSLLPSKQRTGIVNADLDGIIKSDPFRAPDAALLSAYLAYQAGDDARARMGIERLEQSSDFADQRLAVFLRGIWLGEIQESVPPADPPANDDGIPQEDDAD
ncbi:MAG: hypothetical protein KIS87_12495 [Phycisphaeraceae bacterium]|nr:hypothetical protein [Phycisphaeraceae bacterium]